MRYKAIFTHDPQDYFNGDISAEETSEILDFDDSVESCVSSINTILNYVANGYKAIILLREGDDTG